MREQFLKNLCQLNKVRVEKSLLSSKVLSIGTQLEDFLKRNKLANENETLFEIFDRCCTFLAEAGVSFYGKNQIERYRTRFLRHVCSFEIVLGSPILSNAGRRSHKSVSACSIPSLVLSKMTKETIASVISSYHILGMGTGFSLDDLDDPVEMVKYLNHLAIQEVQSGVIERSVGNMGVLSIDHPQILPFIRIRENHPEIKEWKFNLSVNLTKNFFENWVEKKPFFLRNNEVVDPDFLMRFIAENAHASGDPGLIFMDRINALNKVPQIGDYKTVVPCGEVSLHEGEVCQFAYLNMIRFIRNGKFLRTKLKEAIHSAMILLDNAVEANIYRMPNELSKERISSLRRVGLGLCGFSEMLQAMGFSYDSDLTRTFAKDLMSFINYESKRASIDLAKERGAFSHFDHPMTRQSLFLDQFARKPTNFVSEEDWKILNKDFKKYKIRNLSTTILPPSGRSSLLGGVTGSIEPHFRLVNDSLFQRALKSLCEQLQYSANFDCIANEVNLHGSLQNLELPEAIKGVFRTALEVSPRDHVLMAAAFQEHVDEGISKTVNLPHDATVEDVVGIFKLAYQSGLKGVTVYRDGCRSLQPKTYNTSKEFQMIVDPIYGSFEIEPRLQKLLNTPLIQRLKGVHQNGADYLTDPRIATSRFEHSVGAMLLVNLLGGTVSHQISALLHDVSHTVFSHVVDQVFIRENQDYHNFKYPIFLQSLDAKKTLYECGITQDEIEYYKVPFIAGKGLTVDNLDYVIRDLMKVNKIFQPEYSSILNNIFIGDEGEIMCKTVDTARFVFRKFLEVNLRVYFNPLSEVGSLVMATLLRRGLDEGLIIEEDLFSTDENVMGKMLSGPYRSTLLGIAPKMEYFPGVLSDPFVLRKLRYVNPKIEGLRGRLTDHCRYSERELNEYLKTPTRVHYRIPLIEAISPSCVT